LALTDLQELNLNTENLRWFVYRAMFDMDIATKLRTFMMRDLQGFRSRSAKQSINVVFSQRKGFEVEKQLIDHIKKK